MSYVIALTDGVENSVINFNNPGAVFASQAVDPNFSLFAPTQKIGPRDDIQGFNPESCDNIKNDNHTFAFVNPTSLVPDTG